MSTRTLEKSSRKPNMRNKKQMRYKQSPPQLKQTLVLMKDFLVDVPEIDEIIQCVNDHEELKQLVDQNTVTNLHKLFSGLNSKFTYDEVEDTKVSTKQQQKQVTPAKQSTNDESSKDLAKLFNSNRKKMIELIKANADKEGFVLVVAMRRILAKEFNQQIPGAAIVEWCEKQKNVEISKNEKKKAQIRIVDPQTKVNGSVTSNNRQATSNNNTTSKKPTIATKQQVATPKLSVADVFTTVKRVLEDIENVSDISEAVNDHESLSSLLSVPRLRKLYKIFTILDEQFEGQRQPAVQNKQETPEMAAVFKKIQDFISVVDIKDVVTCVEDTLILRKLLSQATLAFMQDFFTQLEPLFHYNEKPKANGHRGGRGSRGRGRGRGGRGRPNKVDPSPTKKN